MNKKDLGLILGSLFIVVMIISSVTSGIVGLILSSVVYYFGTGLLVMELTSHSDNILTWLIDLFED